MTQEFSDDFDGPELDTDVWIPHYLPSQIGQQPFGDGAVVREFQPTQWGWTPHYGRLEVRARMDLTPRSMAAVWMVGLEDEPTRCAEICIFEVFGDALQGKTAASRPPTTRCR